MASSKAIEQAARELYGLPPGDFTKARDARVKELRKQGEREAAEAVKALRKPTVAAWALNQLARTRSKDVERLIAAGEELRSAQEELLGGGDRSAFQEAAGAERELVAELSADAATLTSEAGERSGGLREKVAETLHAAALDDETAEELRAGRLTREREAIGGFGAPGGGPAAAPSRRQAKPKPKKAPSRSKVAAAADGGDAERKQRLAAARTDERHAQRELDSAAKAVQHAQERADAARKHADEAAQRAKTTAERLKEAKKAERSARKAHEQAARALESAEDGAGRKS